MSVAVNADGVERSVQIELQVGASSAMDAAVQRLRESRERLLTAVTQGTTAPRAATSKLAPRWTDHLKRIPGVGLALPLFEAWWSQTTVNSASVSLLQAVNAVLKPAAARHPVFAVLCATSFGAALAWSRPWRWIFKSALVAGVAARMTGQVMSRIPIESWFSLLSSIAQGAAKRSSAAPASRQRSASPEQY